MTARLISKDAVAFVLSGEVSGLGTIRSLGQERVPMRIIDSAPTPGMFSRYGKKYFSPHPLTATEQALAFLIEQGEGLDRKGILFPASDLWANFVSENRAKLSEHFEMVLPPERLTKALTNKRCQHDEATRLGIPIAETHYPTTLAEVEELKDRLDYPVFVKPYQGHLWRRHFPNKGFLAENSRQLVSIYEKVLPLGLSAMVQTIVLGPNTNHFEVCMYFSSKGTMFGPFVAQKIRQYPVDFGMGTLLQSAHNPEAAALGEKLLRGMDYRGIADVEFKRDERDGKYKMLDINCRYWFQTYQATCAGMNFPLNQYLDLTGQETLPATGYRDGVKWLNAPSDLISYQDRANGHGIDWNGLIRSWMDVDCYAYFSKRDIRPSASRMISKRTFVNFINQLRGEKPTVE